MLNKISQKISNLQSYLSICYSQRIRGMKREKKKLLQGAARTKKLLVKNPLMFFFA